MVVNATLWRALERGAGDDLPLSHTAKDCRLLCQGGLGLTEGTIHAWPKRYQVGYKAAIYPDIDAG